MYIVIILTQIHNELEIPYENQSLNHNIVIFENDLRNTGEVQFYRARLLIFESVNFPVSCVITIRGETRFFDEIYILLSYIF